MNTIIKNKVNISIINILNQKLNSIQGIQIKICASQNNESELLFWGNTDLCGQVFLSHNYSGKANVYVNDEYHSDIELPCLSSIIVNQ